MKWSKQPQSKKAQPIIRPLLPPGQGLNQLVLVKILNLITDILRPFLDSLNSFNSYVSNLCCLFLALPAGFKLNLFLSLKSHDFEFVSSCIGGFIFSHYLFQVVSVVFISAILTCIIFLASHLSSKLMKVLLTWTFFLSSFYNSRRMMSDHTHIKSESSSLHDLLFWTKNKS